MRRRMFTALSVLSLALCLATVALWVRSYWRTDYYSWHDETLVPAGVRRELGFALFYPPKPLIYSESGWICFRTDASYDPSTGKFFVSSSTIGYVVPHWIVGLGAAALSFWMFRLRRSPPKPRWPAGRCSGCGYDLRATPDRCPECGKVFGQTSEFLGKPSA